MMERSKVDPLDSCTTIQTIQGNRKRPIHDWPSAY